MDSVDSRESQPLGWSARALELAGVAALGIDNGGRVNSWSLAACEIYGYAYSEVVRRSPDFLCFPGESTLLRSLPFAESGREVIEQHRRKDGSRIVVRLRFVTLPGGLLAVAHDITEGQHTAASEAANRRALDETRRALRRFARRLVDAQESERERIACELHDDFKQRLGLVSLELAALAAEQSSAETEERLTESLMALAKTVAGLGSDLRRVSHQLHPAPLSRLGLAATLEATAAEVEARSGLKVRVSLVLTADQPAGEVALGIYRIAQEALENVVRHAQASKVHVSLVCEASKIQLSVADDGIGFDPDVEPSRAGLGLASIRGRATLLGGRLRVASAPGASTEIELTLAPQAGNDKQVLEVELAAEEGGSVNVHRRLIGPYRLLNVLGEGTMAVVYLAEEPPPLARRVALKVYRVPLAQHHKVFSYRAEHQALARIRHPNVGLIHEARTTEDGQPYIVMEYIPGLPLTDYCHRYRLGLRQRIALFVTVCEAVQHIHQKGVLHRDLKPANVLVMEEKGRPIPKIVDFGIAKGIDNPLAEGTVWTQGALGTPIYMSPEVLAGKEADTRCDVYALGVILYELLACDRSTVDQDEFLQQLATGTAKPPSQRVRALTSEQLEALAGNRQVGSAGLVRSLRGDLDWITSKALAVEPEKRYVGASALAEDLDRHLRSEPVLAGPPDLSYRLGRFFRRHLAVVVSAALLFMALIVGLMATTWQARRAEREASEARHVTEFLEEIFKVAAPNEARGHTVTAREILQPATERLRFELAKQPRLRARLLETLGNVHRSLGLFDEARPLLEESVELRRRTLGESHPETAKSLRSLAYLKLDTGQSLRAEPLLRRVLKLQEQARGTDPLEIAETLEILGLLTHRKADGHAEADAISRRAHNIISLALPPHDPRFIRSLANLSRSALSRGDYAESTALLHQAVELGNEHLGPDHPEILKLLIQEARLYKRHGDYPQARILYERMVPRWTRVFGEGHTYTLNIRLNLVEVYGALGMFAIGQAEAEACYILLKENFGADNTTTLRAAKILGDLSNLRGEFEEARAIHQLALDIATSTDPLRRSTINLTFALSLSAYLTGDLVEAERLATSLLTVKASKAPEYLSIGARKILADIAFTRGDMGQAERLSHEIHSDLEADFVLYYSRRGLIENHLRLGRILAAREDTNGARKHWKDAIELANQSPHHIVYQAWRAVALLLMGRVEEARPLAQRILRTYRFPELIELCELHGIDVPPLADQ